MNPNKPKVIIDNGSVRSLTIGFTTEFIKRSIAPARIATQKLATNTPEMKYPVANTESESISNLNSVLNINQRVNQ